MVSACFLCILDMTMPLPLDKPDTGSVNQQDRWPTDTLTHSRTPSGWINTVPLSSQLSTATLSKRSTAGSSCKHLSVMISNLIFVCLHKLTHSSVLDTLHTMLIVLYLFNLSTRSPLPKTTDHTNLELCAPYVALTIFHPT